MVTKVEGFLTSTGKFYEDQAAANLHETNYNLRICLLQFVEGLIKDNLVDDPLTYKLSDEYLTEGFLTFIAHNQDVVAEYIEAVRNMEVRDASERDESDKASDNGATETRHEDGSVLPSSDSVCKTGNETGGQSAETSESDDSRVRSDSNSTVEGKAETEAEPPPAGRGNQSRLVRGAQKPRNG